MNDFFTLPVKEGTVIPPRKSAVVVAKKAWEKVAVWLYTILTDISLQAKFTAFRCVQSPSVANKWWF